MGGWGEEDDDVINKGTLSFWVICKFESWWMAFLKDGVNRDPPEPHFAGLPLQCISANDKTDTDGDGVVVDNDGSEPHDDEDSE